MKKINITFEQDETLENIDVLVRASEEDSEITALYERIDPAEHTAVAVSDINGVQEMIPASEIILLSVNGKQASVITKDSRYIARKPLNAIEAVLDPGRFVRISRYEIVNLTKIVKYDFTLGGTLRIELMGGMETWASRRCIPQIRRRLSGRRDTDA